MYLYAAVTPPTGARMAPQANNLNTGAMNVFPRMLSDDPGPRDHAALIMDQAAWPSAKALAVPENVTILDRRPTASNSTRPSGCGLISAANTSATASTTTDT